ncbi:hypothetical protein Tco_0769248 [Tanacetum coccineum]|uniref:Uncharacterized protein n=1 Tax=Tanacetum coccineum TaxID=301880 RepID=A0ABQ4Z9S8_9ASTR
MIRTREGGNRSIVITGVDIITSIPGGQRFDSIRNWLEELPGGRRGRVIVEQTSKNQNITFGSNSIPQFCGIDLGRMSSPANSLERESILGEELIEMSRFSMDSTRSDSASKESIPGGIEWMPSSTSNH